MKNTGGRAGEEIVQCYVRDVAATRVRPVKELKGYQKTALAAGETKKVEFFIPRDQLGFYGRDGQYVVEPGEFTVMVGGSSADTLEQTVIL